MIKEYHKNPRTIKSGRLNAIRNNIKELGDLSGITVDLNTNEVITGNQRAKIIDLNSCEIEIMEELKKPDRQGTVRRGYVVWDGVKLDCNTFKLVNIRDIKGEAWIKVENAQDDILDGSLVFNFKLYLRNNI